MAENKINIPDIQQLMAMIEKPDRFEAWLQAKPDGAMVGKQHLCTSCPLTNWLSDEGFTVNIGDMFSMGRIRLFTDSTRTAIVDVVDTPEWMVDFARQIDESTEPEKELIQREGWDKLPSDQYDEVVETHYEKVDGVFDVSKQIAVGTLRNVLD